MEVRPEVAVRSVAPHVREDALVVGVVRKDLRGAVSGLKTNEFALADLENGDKTTRNAEKSGREARVLAFEAGPRYLGQAEGSPELAKVAQRSP